MSELGPVVDIAFGVTLGAGEARSIPADHGYALFSALAKVIPWIHAREAVGVHSIRGRLSGDRSLFLAPGSEVVLRCPAVNIPEVLPVSGKSIEIDHARFVLGVPTVRILRPAASVQSRLVVIKGMMDPETLRHAAETQLAQLGIRGSASVPARSEKEAFGGGRSDQAGTPLRRTIRIRDRVIAGYALRVTELSPEDSLKLQAHGLGGRRRFGCGLFVPPPLGRTS